MSFTSDILLTGAWTGFVATLVMTAVILIVKKSGNAPMDLFVMLGRQALGKKTKEADARPVGMGMHIVIGVVWGIVFVWLGTNGFLFNQFNYMTGMGFAMLPWMLMMLIALPMMGAGIFGIEKSTKIPLVTLILHLVYGASLGALVLYSMG
jgi:hypothetical protein